MVEFAGVVEAVEQERRPAEDVKVLGLGSAFAAEEDVESDGQVQEPHCIHVVEEGAALHRPDDHGVAQIDAVALDFVFGLVPGADSEQYLGDAERAPDGQAVDGNQNVAGPESRAGGRAVGVHAARLDAEVGVDPGNAVVGQFKLALLLQIQQAGQDRPDGQDREQDTREPKVEIAEQPTLTRRRPLHAEGHTRQHAKLAKCHFSSYLGRQFRRAPGLYGFWKILYRNWDRAGSSLLDLERASA